MSLIKKLVFVVCALIYSNKSFSQSNDSIPQHGKEKADRSQYAVFMANRKFAMRYPLVIEMTHSTSDGFTLKEKDRSPLDGKVDRLLQIKVDGNMNFIRRKNYFVGALLGYRYISGRSEMDVPDGDYRDHAEHEYHYFYTGVNFTYLSMLFKKRVIYTSSVILDGSEKHVERIRGMLTGTMILRADANTRMSVGLMVNVDRSSEFPFLPVFSYEHILKNGFIVDLVFPRSIYFRKLISGKGRISLGTEFDQTSFYLYNIKGVSQTYQYNQLNMNSGLVYEQPLGKGFLITVKGGVGQTLLARIFKKEDSYHNSLYKLSYDPAFYFNAAISFSPF